MTFYAEPFVIVLLIHSPLSLSPSHSRHTLLPRTLFWALFSLNVTNPNVFAIPGGSVLCLCFYPCFFSPFPLAKKASTLQCAKRFSIAGPQDHRTPGRVMRNFFEFLTFLYITYCLDVFSRLSSLLSFSQPVASPPAQWPKCTNTTGTAPNPFLFFAFCTLSC